MIISKLSGMLAYVSLIVLLSTGIIQASQETADPALTSVVDIKVSFKLDTRITRGMYMGDRWVSPPSYISAHEGTEAAIEAKAQGLDARGNGSDISPVWTSGDPAMIAVSPDRGHKVKLTILKEGQSDLTATFGGISKKLTVKARHQDKGMHVEIKQ